MKKGLKFKIATGIASIAMVAPLVLGGVGASANQVENANTSRLGQTEQYNNRPQYKGNSNTSQPQGNNTNSNNNKNSNGKPKKTISMKQFQEMMKKQAKRQAAQQKKMVRESKPTLLLVGHHSIYRVHISNKGQILLLPGTVKYWGSTRRYNRMENYYARKYQRNASSFRRYGRVKNLVNAYHSLVKWSKNRDVASVPAKEEKTLKKDFAMLRKESKAAEKNRHTSKHGKKVARNINKKLNRRTHHHARRHGRKSHRGVKMLK